MIDFGQLVREQVDSNQKIYEIAHAEGYRAGFVDGVKEAQKIVEKTLGQMMEKNT